MFFSSIYISVPSSLFFVVSFLPIWRHIRRVRIAERVGVLLELSRWLKWSSLIGTAFVLIIILIDFGVLDYRQWDTVASAF